MTRGLPRCIVCKEEAAFTDRRPVVEGDGVTLWVHERCATQLAATLLLPALKRDEMERKRPGAVRAVDRAGLTPRELIALRCMASGYTNRQIAMELRITHKTARNLVSSVLGKLDAVNRAAAVAIATREGLLDE